MYTTVLPRFLCFFLVLSIDNTSSTALTGWESTDTEEATKVQGLLPLLSKLFNRNKEIPQNSRRDPSAQYDLTRVYNSGRDASGVTIIFKGVRQACLSTHNKVRDLHRKTPPMVYDASLESDAQVWARYLAKTGKFEHDNSGYGENLYKRWVWGKAPPTNIARAVFSWYDERKDYVFSTGQSKGGVIGHFTQLVWTTSTRVACAVATVERNGFTETVIVARYAPHGNYYGENRRRVKYYKQGALRRLPNKWEDLVQLSKRARETES